MDTWTPARVLFNPELEILQLMEDYQKRSFSGLSFNRKIKSALNKNARKLLFS